MKKKDNQPKHNRIKEKKNHRKCVHRPWVFNKKQEQKHTVFNVEYMYFYHFNKQKQCRFRKSKFSIFVI